MLAGIKNTSPDAGDFTNVAGLNSVSKIASGYFKVDIPSAAQEEYVKNFLENVLKLRAYTFKLSDT